MHQTRARLCCIKLAVSVLETMNSFSFKHTVLYSFRLLVRIPVHGLANDRGLAFYMRSLECLSRRAPIRE